MKIITLLENKSRKNKLRCEHGLSFYIEVDNFRLLFDAGQSNKLIHNAQELNIDLTQLDAIVISHGHYDHTGAIPELLTLNTKAKVYAHRHIFKTRYSWSPNMTKSNGIAWADQADKWMDRFVFIDTPTSLHPLIHLFPNITDTPEYTIINHRLVEKEGDELIPDKFEDEVVMTLGTKDSTVLISGCAHHGIVNILNHVMNLFGNTSYKLVAGGMHLNGRSDEEINEVIHQVSKFKVEKWAINHCTGDNAIELFKGAFANKIVEANVGSTFEV